MERAVSSPTSGELGVSCAHWSAQISGTWLEKVLPRECATEPLPYSCLWRLGFQRLETHRSTGMQASLARWKSPSPRAGWVPADTGSSGRHRLQRLSGRIICSSQRRSVHVEDSHSARWEPAGRARPSERQGACPLLPQDSWLPCPEFPVPWGQWRPLGRVCARSQGSGPSGRGGAATSGLGSCQPLTREFGLGAGGPAGTHPEQESPQVRRLSRSCP